MMIVTEQGFNHRFFVPNLAQILGDGSEVLAEAAVTNCAYIEPLHFLGFLAKSGGTILRTEFLEPRHVTPDIFCDLVYEVGFDMYPSPGIPIQFDLEALSPATIGMLETFVQAIESHQLNQGTEELFLSVLLDCLEPQVQNSLQAMAGSDEQYEEFRALLKRRLTGVELVEVFDEAGQLKEAEFDKSGKRVLSRLREETAALGYKKISAMHLLYALVGIENGVMQRAFQYQAIDPVQDIHSYLSRELTRPGRKRVEDLSLTRQAMYESVIHILQESAGMAARDGQPINEVHIARALVGRPPGMVASFLNIREVNLDILCDYIARTQAEAETENPNANISITCLETELKQRILGQDQAIRRILPWIKRLRFGYPRERGPAAVLLFLGPSGTGKTQLAKELARIVYGDEDQIVMLEMGQFNSKESSNIFIGAPPGYVGYGEGRLTNGLRDNPESVVLFDEIEKAHEDVWVTLMRFLDEGLINDPAGPTRDGRRCLVVLTSNLGVEEFATRTIPEDDENPQAQQALEQLIREVVVQYLKRPEIYNRVDDKVVFRSFDAQTYEQLIANQVHNELEKFWDLYGVKIEVESEVFRWLTEQAEEAQQEGARCVPRIVNCYLISPIIDLLTTNEEQLTSKIIISARGFKPPIAEIA